MIFKMVRIFFILGEIFIVVLLLSVFYFGGYEKGWKEARSTQAQFNFDFLSSQQILRMIDFKNGGCDYIVPEVNFTHSFPKIAFTYTYFCAKILPYPQNRTDAVLTLIN